MIRIRQTVGIKTERQGEKSGRKRTYVNRFDGKRQQSGAI